MRGFALILIFCCSYAFGQSSMADYRFWFSSASGGPKDVYSINADGSGYHLSVSTPYVATGFIPNTVPIKASNGYMYGVLTAGGANNQGVIYRMNPDGTGYEVIFDMIDSSYFPGLVEGADHRLYGINWRGIYVVDLDGENYELIYNSVLAQGYVNPYGLILASNGLLYGHTDSGGTSNKGMLFKFDPVSKTYTNLASFDGTNTGDPVNTQYSQDKMVEASDGYLYGTRPGGPGNRGIIFRIKLDGTGFAQVFNFQSVTDRTYPNFQLLEGPDGYLYATTESGLIKVKKDGTDYTIIKAGLGARYGVTLGSDGKLYGTGSTFSPATLFAFRISTNGSNYEQLTTISGGIYGGLKEGSNGIFFGIQTESGPAANGAIIKIDANAKTQTVAKNFPASSRSPNALYRSLIGELYGMFQADGPSGRGGLFRLSTDGTDVMETLYESAQYNDPSFQSLVMNNQGVLFGRGVFQPNGVYKLSPDRLTIEDKGDQPSSNGPGKAIAINEFIYYVQSPNGTGGPLRIYKAPADDLSAGELFYEVVGLFNEIEYEGIQFELDGWLYGSAATAGYGNGFIFRVNLDTKEFQKILTVDPNTMGYASSMMYMIASDGKVYVSASSHTGSSGGYFHRFNPDGSNFETLYSLPPNSPTLGSFPRKLIEGVDGLLYGFNRFGGSKNGGVFFSLSKTGQFTKIYDLDASPTDMAMIRKSTVMIQIDLQNTVYAPNKRIPLNATSPLPDPFTYTSSDPSVATVDGNELVVHAPGTTMVVPLQISNFHSTAVNLLLTITKVPQTITFNLSTPKPVGSLPIDLTATATSGLAVSYSSSNSSIAEIVGNTIVIKAAGTVDITASQPGDNIYSPATPVVRQLVITKGAQTINFAEIQAVTYGDDSFPITATATSGLEVEFSTASEKIDQTDLETGLVTLLKPGKVSITASQAGNSNYNAAPNVVRTFCINPPKPFIVANPVAGTVSLVSSNDEGNQWYRNGAPINGANGIFYIATQAGDYHVISTVETCASLASDVKAVTIAGTTPQTITFNALEPRAYGAQPFNLTATASSGLAVTFASSNSAIAEVNGTTVTIKQTGTVNIIASQGGNGTYASAADVIRQLVINKATQTITFEALTPRTAKSSPSFDLVATASSGLPITFSSANTEIAEIDGIKVTIRRAGKVNITASQPGNGNYEAAADIVRELVINDKATQTIDFPTITSKSLSDNSFTPVATSTSGLAVVFTTASDKITINAGTAVLIKAGVASITANQAGDDTYKAAPDITQSFCINPAKPNIQASAVGETVLMLSSNTEGNQWYKDGNAISGATGTFYTATASGNYHVVTTVESCASLPSDTKPVAITGLDEFAGLQLEVYPNPVTSKLYVELKGIQQDVDIELIDMAGRSVRREGLYFRGSHSMDVSDLSTGVYILKLSAGEKVFRARVLK